MSTQTLTELPLIQQSGMDFDTVVAEIKDIIKNHPNWKTNWPEFYESDAGVMLINLMGWVMDNMSTKQDVLVNEMFLSTAQDEQNVLKLLKQIGYNPRKANSAKVAIRLDFNSIPTANIYLTKQRNLIENRINEICRFTGKNTSGGSTTYEVLKITDGKPDYLEAIILKAGSISYEVDKNNNTIYALEGETKYKEFTTDSSDGNYFDLNDDDIAADSIQVYIKKSMKKLIEVSSFISTDALDETKSYPYVTETNLDRTTRIRFGNKDILSSSRLIPAGTTISVFYRTTSGSAGNISPGFINTSLSLTASDGQSYTCTVTNDLLGNNGADAETIDNAKLNGPLSLRTMDRAVTYSDYNIILNQNANIFKSKTYTASNQPDGFKNYYGRYINPQEAFSIIMLNKNYQDVPAAQYNNFPWIDLTKQPRLNERYLFDKGDYDGSCSIGSTYFNFTAMLTDSTTKTFKNATLLRLSDAFNGALYSDSGAENSILKLKLSTEKTTENFFDNIEFSLMYPDDNTLATANQITMENNYLSHDENARYITSSYYDNDTPLDVSKSRYINLIVDGNSVMRIDLWSQRRHIIEDGEETDEWGSNEYYLKWTNTGIETAKESWGNSKLQSSAAYRDGIVELINKSIAGLTTDSSGNFKYLDGYSFQYFGMNMTNKNSAISNLSSSEYNFTFTINNNKTFKMKYTAEVFKSAYKALYTTTAPSSIAWNSLEGLACVLNYYFQSLNSDGFYVLNNSSWIKTTFKTYFNTSYPTAEVVEIVNTDTDEETSDDFTMIYNGYDLRIGASGSTLLADVTYVDDEKFSHTLKNVFWIEDYYNLNNDMFVHTLKGNSNRAKLAHDLIVEPTQAATYESLASFEKISDEEDETNGWFMIKSPITGNASSIMFKYDKQNDVEYGNFMKDYLGLSFNNAGYSYKAYGVRKIYMLKKDAIKASVVYNGEETTQNETLVAGNLIFQNSCITNNHDFTTLFANYKTSTSSSIVIGSTYDNFYYSGDSATDELLKTDIAGIEGQYMGYNTLANGVKSYYIDPNKSDLDVRFTSAKQDTNSLFAIEQDLDIVACDRVKILTKSINSKMPEGSAIKIQIDSYDPVVIDISEKQGSAITSSIVSVLKKSGEQDLIDNVNTIARDSYLCLNQIQIQNLTKENGKIIFSYPTNYNEANVKQTYKNFFGTNLENPDFYNLYPKSMFYTDCIVYVDTDMTEYYYCPTTEKSLKFTYRKLVETNSDGIITYTSREPDYYIEIQESELGDQKQYRFLLNKTENSKFPDTYFYMHFINDRTYEYDENGNLPETDENTLNAYMKNHMISGSKITFIKPYFRTYDIMATIKYNANFNQAEVVSKVNNAVDELCSIKNAEIAGSMSRAKILKTIMNIDGVEDCKINYFGYDYQNDSPSVDTLTADFFEILCINDTGDNTGKIFTFEVME